MKNKTIAFLHTGDVHIDKFERLTKNITDDINIKHYVNSDMLDRAISTGIIDKQVFQSEVNKIKREKPDLIICTCSTFGAVCDELEGEIHRIDYPIVEFLVSNFNEIGLAFTASSTKESSTKLIQNVSSKLNKEMRIMEIDCSTYWSHFENSEYDDYHKGIAKELEKQLEKIDAVFLAQASMEGALKFLKESHLKKVYTSPAIGVEKLLALI